ncbi:MAG: ATP synthase F1 subunit gamma [Porphyromonadaceae bacterium CG2_30_38_12]|nr:MAG: ATP synthase F1 subunit gamma [Porphyromonadaceae bacterium CG2_30_38_12]
MSLKEIKSRIQSVKSTEKITSAMKMVSSAKLRKAERAVANFLPYKQGMNKILENYLQNELDTPSPYAQIRDIKHVAVLVFASNSSLCGSYNANLIKRLQQSIKTHRDVRKEDVIVYPVGKKAMQACVKLGLECAGDYQHIANNPTFDEVAALADSIMQLFLNKEIDRVKMIYYHYASKGSQQLVADTFLPVDLGVSDTKGIQSDYIIEPSRSEVIEALIPMVLRLRVFGAALEAYASEHAARTMAMQIATDNAGDLLQELSLQYNKSRQQSITNELLDIVGASFK